MEQRPFHSADLDVANRRAHNRLPVFSKGEITFWDQTSSCVVEDISPGGARLRVSRPIVRGSFVNIDVAGRGSFSGTVKWCDNGLIGVTFSVEQRGLKPAFVSHAKRERLYSRHETSYEGSVSCALGTSTCKIVNLSNRGARVVLDGVFSHDSLLTLSIVSIGDARGHLAWQIRETLGIAFFEDQSTLVELFVSRDAVSVTK